MCVDPLQITLSENLRKMLLQLDFTCIEKENPV